MNANSGLLILGGLLFLVYYYYKLVATTRFNARWLWLWPPMLGFFVVRSVPPTLLADSHLLESTVLSIALGLANGIIQGYFITIVRGSDGALYQKGSWTVALVLLLTMPLRFGLRYLVLGRPVLATGGASQEVLFAYLAMFLAIVLGRVATLVLRYPALIEAALS